MEWAGSRVVFEALTKLLPIKNPAISDGVFNDGPFRGLGDFRGRSTTRTLLDVDASEHNQLLPYASM